LAIKPDGGSLTSAATLTTEPALLGLEEKLGSDHYFTIVPKTGRDTRHETSIAVAE